MSKANYFSYIEKFGETDKPTQEAKEFLYKQGSWPEPNASGAEGWTCTSGTIPYQDPSSDDFDEDKLKSDIAKAKIAYTNLKNSPSSEVKKVLDALWGGHCYNAPNGNMEEGYFTGPGILGCTNAYGQVLPDCACDYHCFPNTLGCTNILNDGNGSAPELITAEFLQATECECANDVGIKVNCFDMCGRYGAPEEERKTTGCCANNHDDPTYGSCSLTEQSDSKDSGEDGDGGGDSDCPKPTFNNNLTNLSNLADSMGMNQKCVTEQKEIDNSGQMCGAMVGLAGIGGMSGSYTNSYNDTSSSGCAQASMNVSQNSQNINNIACNITNVDQTQRVVADSVALTAISFRDPTDSQKAIQQQMVESAQKSYDNIANTILLNPDKFKNKEVADRLIDRAAQAVQKAESYTDSGISGSTITTDANVQIVQKEKSDARSATEVINDTISAIKQSVSDKVINNFELGSLQPNTKDVIDSEVSNNLSNITASIVNVLQNQTVTAGADATTDITLAAGNWIDNTTISTDSSINLTQMALNKVTNVIADQITNKITDEATNDYSSDNTSKGVAQIIDALGKANADAISAFGDLLGSIAWGFWLPIIAVVVCVIIFLPMLGKLFGGEKKPGEGGAKGREGAKGEGGAKVEEAAEALFGALKW